jgi:hypothetical protein
MATCVPLLYTIWIKHSGNVFQRNLNFSVLVGKQKNDTYILSLSLVKQAVTVFLTFVTAPGKVTSF